jgi:excisionase family DNA binding protein
MGKLIVQSTRNPIAHLKTKHVHRAGAARRPLLPEFEFSVLLVEKRMPAFDQRRSGSGLPKYYSIKSVAEALEVSTRTVRQWIARGELIAHGMNGVLRIADADLHSFLARHRET